MPDPILRQQAQALKQRADVFAGFMKTTLPKANCTNDLVLELAEIAAALSSLVERLTGFP